MHNGDHRRSVRLESRDWTARAVKPRRVREPPPMKGLNDETCGGHPGCLCILKLKKCGLQPEEGANQGCG